MKWMDFIKGVGVGMVAGAILSYTMDPPKTKCKTVKRKLIKAAEDVIDSISDTIHA